MSNLSNQKCAPCEGGVEPLSRAEAEIFLGQVNGWILDDNAKQIHKDFKFKDFLEAMIFVNKVANIAEGDGHHPDIIINYNKVHLELSTHAIGGLSINDFILASKIDIIT